MPVIKDFVEDYLKSLEEFGVIEKSISLVDLYYLLKKSKIRYRFSLDDLAQRAKTYKVFEMFFKTIVNIKNK